MKKNSISPYLLVISIMTFVTLFVATVSQSYDNLINSTRVSQNNSLGKTIDFNLKTDVIKIIESRR
ncbi:hypothetical protein CO009_04350 [Candidatus Shapirobacteria bacterium CG_4_8_14_3_um_filter_35_11]|uniref:Uncharacterized protein n=4 Tax=Candidatus Shapironibacteriota TaxID=1752721 RepID=A0A2M7XPJ2_9BACT|nr:MAG: hypothetical protein COS53_02965 [Candidatus Shapirobacteria bacterium CG03_land_8_20_14_0_80_35_14]PJA51322.1 MAG: hypothetical protein CO168_00380 [Candidatus Shapirobacteria bacterium CG_4_9_14_3_um_filter_36_12]PJC79596.1 MAG: hypothetical protein CO009_04350 [Candidatus Shapirobacteria bacterium CG_4_8_14_3_um_filter_35_11]PJE66494.1 MAG: hypothetical protein COU93_04065 [Candidatus Shapirobacteria bacterium CG10_big_fil_rev_8_21_14_0_10_36_6]